MFEELIEKINTIEANVNLLLQLHIEQSNSLTTYNDVAKFLGKTRKTVYNYINVNRGVRAAYRSLRTNLPYLFTYKNNKHLSISNTTNALEGGVFSHMKNMISLHRGLSKSLKLNLVDYYLVSYKKK